MFGAGHRTRDSPVVEHPVLVASLVIAGVSEYFHLTRTITVAVSYAGPPANVSKSDWQLVLVLGDDTPVVRPNEDESWGDEQHTEGRNPEPGKSLHHDRNDRRGPEPSAGPSRERAQRRATCVSEGHVTDVLPRPASNPG